MLLSEAIGGQVSNVEFLPSSYWSEVFWDPSQNNAHWYHCYWLPPELNDPTLFLKALNILVIGHREIKLVPTRKFLLAG